MKNKVIDYNKKCTVPMININTGKVEFKLTIFGRVTEDLMRVPCEVSASLAAKYPNHTSNMFMVY